MQEYLCAEVLELAGVVAKNEVCHHHTQHLVKSKAAMPSCVFPFPHQHPGSGDASVSMEILPRHLTVAIANDAEVTICFLRE